MPSDDVPLVGRVANGGGTFTAPESDPQVAKLLAKGHRVIRRWLVDPATSSLQAECAPMATEAGTRVSYEDMANPRRYGTVTGVSAVLIRDPNYEITWDDGTIDYSDLRQSGWRFES